MSLALASVECLALALAGILPAVAQTAASAAAFPRPELSGIWLLAGGMNEWETNGRRFSPGTPPLQPWALEKYRANRAGLPDSYDGALDQMDPNTYCFPPGAPRSMLMPYPFEIVQRPDQVYILFEYGSGVRRIYTDGRKHPDDAPAAWMGHSIGTWQGDLLVVDTVALREETWLDRVGTPHSEALRMRERFRRPNSSSLEVEFWLEDSKAFTQPWGGKKTYEPGFEITEYIICEEHLKMGVAGGAAGGNK